MPAVAYYTEDRLEHPQCAYCLRDMLDNLSTHPGEPGDGGDPEHSLTCPVVLARNKLWDLGIENGRAYIAECDKRMAEWYEL